MVGDRLFEQMSTAIEHGCASYWAEWAFSYPVVHDVISVGGFTTRMSLVASTSIGEVFQAPDTGPTEASSGKRNELEQAGDLPRRSAATAHPGPRTWCRSTSALIGPRGRSIP